METRQALELAREKELDLVLVGPTASPPVAKLLDYGKWRYEQQQAEKEARKKAKRQEMKSIKFRVKITSTTIRPNSATCAAFSRPATR